MCVCAGLGVGPGAAASVANPAVAQAAVQAPVVEPPSLIWRDVRRVNILCLVTTDDVAARRELQERLCASAQAFVARGAPAPVRVIPIGDPAVLAAGEVTLLIHASVQSGADGRRLLAFSARPFRVSTEQTAELFGAAPRAVDLAAGAEALDRELAAALAEMVPWRALSTGARPIR